MRKPSILFFLICLLLMPMDFSSAETAPVLAPMDLDKFIKQSSSLLGKSFNRISGKIHLQKKEDTKNKEVYVATNTGLFAERSCHNFDFYFENNKLSGILCFTEEEIAGDVIDLAIKKFKGKGGGVGTGYYAWCINNNSGIDVAIGWGPKAHIGIYKPCPLNLKEFKKEEERKQQLIK